ncbi:MAG TPA: M13-type metalloendopeptidase [Gemmatimonadaceae bacterium]|nr:M13-type metalloendopeptidase [Gemmatimonadaceae bacterium]
MHSRSRLLPALRIAAIAASLVLAPGIVAAQATRSIGIDTTFLDRSVRPQDDFYQFVNGGWFPTHPIPADASRWGSFDELDERSRDAMHTLLEEASRSKAPAGSEERKVGDLYASFMDSARVESLGIAPIKGELARIAAVRSVAELPGAFAHLSRLGVVRPIGVSVDQDEKSSAVNVVHVGQSGLALPDRDYYLVQDARMTAVRQAYKEYSARLLSLAGQPDPTGAAERVLALETALAKRHWDRARTRDRNAAYNRMELAQVVATSPHFDWREFFTAAGMREPGAIIVAQPDYLPALDSLIASTPISTWREYMTVRLLDSFTNELPSGFVQARFEFRGKVLSGTPTIRPRWKRGVTEVEQNLGEAAGKLYVARYFKADAKARMDSLIQNLREAYRIGIDSLEWMAPETKAQAKEKLAHFTMKIAYPDKWRDYGPVRIDRGDLVGNVMRARDWQYQEIVDRLGKPVDRTRWLMTPQTVNAYYLSTNNEIVFPAAILQPPFFDPTADDAANYGGIGAVIGHEIGHGFDDQGRKSDGEGNLRDWWTAADAKAFEERAAKLGAQFEVLSPLEGAHVNPKLTMGENIGDLSGLAQAYRAYRLSLHGKEAPVIGGFTGDQRFFMGYAQIWRTSYRDAALRQQLLSDSHSPGQYRTLIPITNTDAFQRAFDVKPGDKMYRAPEERVRIW